MLNHFTSDGTLLESIPFFDDFQVCQNLVLAGQRHRLAGCELHLEAGLAWVGMDGRLSLGLNARLSHGAVDTIGEDTDDYEVVDINASFEVIEGLDIFGRVENLFDEDYQEIPTYNTSGAAAYAGVRYSF